MDRITDALPSRDSYTALLASVKERIRRAQVRAAVAATGSWSFSTGELGGRSSTGRRPRGGGSKFVERLAKDLHAALPVMRGLSRTNLLYMRAFAEAWPDEAIVQQVVGQSPWGHNVRPLGLVKNPEERLWYAQAAIENGRSRNVLALQIEAGLYRRHGNALTNFEQTLPKPQSDLAQQLLKDPYNFDFLTLAGDAHEREIEAGLLEHLRSFLLELGRGSSFVGSQYPLEIAGEDYRLDLLFYHLHLRCFVVVEIKAGPFKPEYAGKMNSYLAAVDDRLRHPTDQPRIGLVLCRSKKELVVE